MYKIVLAPVDIGQMEAAATALTAVRDFAEREGTEIILLNVIESVPAYVAGQIPAGIHEKVVADAKAALQKMAEDHNLPAGTQLVVREGHPSNTILETAREMKAHVIVMSSHDPVLSDYLLGSVAARVVRHAHCSVLVVRNPPE